MLRDVPALDMYETDEAVKVEVHMPDFKVEVHMPDFKAEEIESSTSGTTLVIKGKRSTEAEIKEEHYYRHETHYGAFTPTVTLPECATVEQTAAPFENGILTITFLKAATAQPKRIDIQAKELACEKGV
ncbi:MAG: Hsp20/alpha crystallin family protein [Chloroflexi bacterium AL-N10]|nr:Hsp20/alpha crystallin family protein [Chloroflexi bacterium AL-N1]NOK66730.1 Hsp20/alpha crystallin family protein [Chloroflexi bacterium AL-N10]NOK72118.1 Hsp20/alpha crystallin family protein [Chloroflexi bacterium AL-N5]